MGDTGDATDIWDTWRRLVRQLPVWRMPYELFFSPSIWTLMGVDFMSGLLKNRSTRRIFEILAPLPAGDLRRIHALAQMNHRRHEAISRWSAIALITLPASAALTLSELSPQTLQAITRWEGFARWYLMLAYLAAVVGFYLLCAWRARQLATVVELAFIQRDVPVAAGATEIEDPIQAPVGA
ncbi:hypothetical protein LRS10_05260 [Phenylobacterium sp. J426]|uniref:hypothetical protein n=1 Tax=Phenylobacterium sp. J426 TaxID=2898439 RepID=UPI002150DF14|nr:hypothetical protein [Phenylobacterium sp. J426]MCR5873633.1 hypothetical protein [Phenylobacterium sp. J426]